MPEDENRIPLASPRPWHGGVRGRMGAGMPCARRPAPGSHRGGQSHRWQQHLERRRRASPAVAPLHAEGTGLSSEFTVATACFRARLPVQQMACLLHFIVLEASFVKDCCLPRQGVSSWDDGMVSAQSPECPVCAPRVHPCCGWVPRCPTWPWSYHPVPLPHEIHTLILFSISPGFKWYITWALLKSKLDVFCASLFYLKFLTIKIWLITCFFHFAKMLPELCLWVCIIVPFLSVKI